MSHNPQKPPVEEVEPLEGQPGSAPPPSTPPHAGELRRSRLAMLIGFLSNVVLRNPKQICLTLILSILATTAQVGLVVLVFRLVQNGSDQMIIGPITLSGHSLWAIPLGLAIAAALIPYLTERYIIWQTVSYFKNAIWRIADAFMDTKNRFKLFAFADDNAALTRLLSTDARYTSLAFAGVLRLVFPVTISVTCFVVLFSLNLKWTLGLFIFVLPFLIWQLRVVASGAALNQELRHAGTVHGRAAARYVGGFSTHFTAMRHQTGADFDPRALITDIFPEAYGRRLRLGISTRLVGDLAVVGLILLVCVLIFAGNFSVESFAGILLYVIVVRFAMTNLSRAMMELISIISQIPFYENYVAAIEALKQQESGAKNDSDEPQSLGANFERIVPGPPCVVFAGESLSWPLVLKFLAGRSGYKSALSDIGDAILISGNFRNFSNDFIEELQLPSIASEADFLEVFPHSGRRWEEFEAAFQDEDGASKAWNEIPRQIKFLCALHYGLKHKSEGGFVFISGVDFSALTPQEKDWVCTGFEGCIMILISNRLLVRRLIPDVENFYLLASNGKLYDAGGDKGFETVVDNAKRFFAHEKLVKGSDKAFDEDGFAEL